MNCAASGWCARNLNKCMTEVPIRSELVSPPAAATHNSHSIYQYAWCSTRYSTIMPRIELKLARAPFRKKQSGRKRQVCMQFIALSDMSSASHCLNKPPVILHCVVPLVSMVGVGVNLVAFMSSVHFTHVQVARRVWG